MVVTSVKNTFDKILIPSLFGKFWNSSGALRGWGEGMSVTVTTKILKRKLLVLTLPLDEEIWVVDWDPTHDLATSVIATIDSTGITKIIETHFLPDGGEVKTLYKNYLK